MKIRSSKSKSPKATPPPVEDATDERIRRSRAAVLAATTALLFERGWSGATIDEIARRSGVAKTTIYRHWPGRPELLRDACAMIATPQRVPDTGDLRGDVTALMLGFAKLLREAPWTAVLPSIADAAEREPAIAEMQRTLQKGHVRPFEIVLRRAIDRGELPAATDIATLIAALNGPLFYRRWFSREPVDDKLARAIVRTVLPAPKT